MEPMWRAARCGARTSWQEVHHLAAEWARFDADDLPSERYRVEVS
jgi:hypothetical protein